MLLEYDADQNRTRKVGLESITTYFDQLYYSVESIATADVEQHFLVSAGGGAVAEVVRTTSQPDATLYHHTDRMGSSAVITDGAGAVLQRKKYDPWGRHIIEDGSRRSELDYTGHRYDAETGLIDMGARFYDPVIARFLNPDPLVTNPLLSQDYNRYSYVRNRPMKYWDPSGLQPVDCGPDGGDCQPPESCFIVCDWGDIDWGEVGEDLESAAEDVGDFFEDIGDAFGDAWDSIFGGDKPKEEPVQGQHHDGTRRDHRAPAFVPTGSGDSPLGGQDGADEAAGDDSSLLDQWGELFVPVVESVLEVGADLGGNEAMEAIIEACPSNDCTNVYQDQRNKVQINKAEDGRKQVFKEASTRKRAIDSRPKPKPHKPKAERTKKTKVPLTRQAKNKKGMGSQGEKHRKGSRHVHDDGHNNPDKPNIHYGYPD